MISFVLDTPYIELIKLLKVTRVAESGGAAKSLVESGQVYRNDRPESRKRAKIVKGEVISVMGKSIRVV
ncbi:MAG: RNA-binding S4 domain-containing protein [Odoribacteraceae bacterium]|jgi:ribosome-associated protein|nr:RNA-binding S4 domain-containing protein [Odoribacteraceae bacterium]